MHIGGERQFEARPEEVYRAMTDPHALGAAFGAIERVEAAGTTGPSSSGCHYSAASG